MTQVFWIFPVSFLAIGDLLLTTSLKFVRMLFISQILTLSIYSELNLGERNFGTILISQLINICCNFFFNIKISLNMYHAHIPLCISICTGLSICMCTTHIYIEKCTHAQFVHSHRSYSMQERIQLPWMLSKILLCHHTRKDAIVPSIRHLQPGG